MDPDIRYVTPDDATAIAYWALEGPGRRPLVILPDPFFHNIELEAADPDLSGFYERLSHSRTLLHYDRRGVGLSEKPEEHAAYSADRHIEDMHAVVLGTAAPNVDPWVGHLGCHVGLAYAQKHPDRVAHLTAKGFDEPIALFEVGT